MQAPSLAPDAASLKSRLCALPSRPWWPYARRTAVALFFVAVGLLLLKLGHSVDWPAVWTALRAYPASTLALAAGLAAGSYAAYAGYELLARVHTGHGVSAVRVAAVGFVVYAFNLSLGASVGAVAMRYRLYHGLGLAMDMIARIFGFCLLTNWLGYFALAGVAFVAFPLELPPDWALGSEGLQLTGVLLALLAAAYLASCCLGRHRTLRWGKHSLQLPDSRLAVGQLVVAGVNWLFVAGVLYVLLRSQVAYVEVLAVLMIAAVAGLVARMPAGLGVLETVFVALLSHRMPASEVLAAVLAYRAIYNLGPLALGAAMLLIVDARARAVLSPRKVGAGRPAPGR